MTDVSAVHSTTSWRERWFSRALLGRLECILVGLLSTSGTVLCIRDSVAGVDLQFTQTILLRDGIYWWGFIRKSSWRYCSVVALLNKEVSAFVSAP